MNSYIQAMFMTKGFRFRVLKLDYDEILKKSKIVQKEGKKEDRMEIEEEKNQKNGKMEVEEEKNK